MTRPWSGPTRQITRFAGIDQDIYSSVQRVWGLSADGERLAWSQYLDENVCKDSCSDVGSGGTAWRATTTTPGRTPVLRCRIGRAPQVALGSGFQVLMNPCPNNELTDDPATVSIDGQVVGHGTQIAAAGTYAAWESPAPGSMVSVYSTASHAVVSTVPAQAAWSLASDGTVVTRDQPSAISNDPPPTTVTATRVGGSPQVLFTETDAIGGVAVAPGTVAYVAVRILSGDALEARIVAYRNGRRLDVSQYYPWWLGGSEVATDGQRVAWISAGCDANRITTARIGEPSVNQLGLGPCPVILNRFAGFDPKDRILRVPLRCNIGIPPFRDPCRAMARVYRKGRLIAQGTVQAYDHGRNALSLTAIGRRQVTGKTRFRAQVVVVRLGVEQRLTTRRTVSFYNERR